MLLTIITFVLVLGILVFAHEIGHFVSAKRLGVCVEEFGFGLPPRIIGTYKDPATKKWKIAGIKTRTRGATIYSFNWIPLGGFVKIKGEQGENPEEEDSFSHKSIAKRIFILSSGVAMNVILALGILTLGFIIGLPREINEKEINSRWAKIKDEKIYVTDVLQDYPAEKANIKPNDIILAINDIAFSDILKLQEYTNIHAKETLKISLERNHKKITAELSPKIEKDGRALMGVLLSKMGIVSYPWYIAIWEGAKATVYLIKEIIIAFIMLFKNLIIAKKAIIELSGPVGIAIITGEVARMGIIYILQFTAILSLNLAIINFLPFPALDGGRVLFLCLEKIRGRAINARIESYIHNIGLYLLFLLVIVITYNDILRFSDKFIHLWGRITQLF